MIAGTLQNDRLHAASRSAAKVTPTQRITYTPLGPVLTPWGVRAGYQSAETVRRSGRTLAVSGSADSHVRYDLETMRAESQRFDRDNGIYQGMITRVIDVILGEGMTLQARTTGRAANQKLEGLWRQFWESPEVRGMDDGATLERLLLRHYFVDGDHGLIKDPRSGLVQAIESAEIATPLTQSPGGNRIENGVELNHLDRPLAYYISKFDEWGMVSTRPAQRIAAKDFIFLANRNRISQTRGTPLQQGNFAMFHRIHDVCDSEAVAWQMLSRIAVAIIRKDAAAIAQEGSTLDEDASDQALARRYHDIGEALIFHGEPGEDIKGIERNIPGAHFTDSIKMFMRLLGLPFGFSLEFVLLIWSDTNYSSGRASIKQVERAVKPWLKMMRRVLGDIYAWKVNQWVRAGLVRGRRDILAHAFHAPPYPFLDPEKEAKAQGQRYDTGVTSPTREAKLEGVDDDELVVEQERDIEKRLAAAQRLNEKYPGAGITAADFTGFVEKRQGGTGAGDSIPQEQ